MTSSLRVAQGGETESAAADQPKTDSSGTHVPAPEPVPAEAASPEIGGRAGLDPTRYGDWELKGRCIDF